MAEKTATFTIPIDAQSNAREAATGLEALRAEILRSQEAVRGLTSASKALRGGSDEVKAARAALKGQIEAEREALSRHNLALLKQGTTYEHLAKLERERAKGLQDQRKREDEARRAAELAAHVLQAQTARAVKELGGPLAQMRERLDSVRTVLAGTSTASGAATIALGALSVGVVAAVVAVGALVAVLAKGAEAFAAFVLEGANWNRTAGIMREAASGSAANAGALGRQIDALGSKVATSRAELQELALTLTRSLLGSRVSGQGLVDTFNAIGQAAAANGSQAANKLQEIIERGKAWGRLGIGLQELQGTGITFEDVAGNLAKQLKIGLDDARIQLFAGWVDVNEGAKAIRTAVEKNFARLNLARMLDLDVLRVKFRDTLTSLTSAIDLTPLLKSLQGLADLFSASTVTGAALRDVVTDLGGAFVGGAASGADLARKAIEQLVTWGLKLDIAFLRLRLGLIDVPGAFAKAFEGHETLLAGIQLAALGAAAGLALLALPLVAIGGSFYVLAKGVALYESLTEKVERLGERMREAFRSIGTAIVAGLGEGITSAWTALKNAVGSVAEGVKSTFRSLLGIHSPSAVFREYGKQTTAGYSEGIEGGAPRVRASVEAMSPRAPAESGGSARGGGPIQVSIEFNVSGGGHPRETAKALAAPDFLATLTKTIEDALEGAGIPTQRAAAA